ncbi:MAG: DEAD/DEAH box helicase [Methanoregulaceae archaeon]|nr:DEAD/DEAH box helicase [Methanoregulaceae archaeon]
MGIGQIVDHLRADQRFFPCVSHIELLPPHEAEYGQLKEPLPPCIASYLMKRGINLYSHQCETIEAVRGGESIVLTTPTASGKTLAFALPILERALSDTDATALVLYPTKALTRDQEKGLRDLEKGTGIRVGPAVYDGDTPRERRPAIRERSRLVLTNPHELHYLLPWHHQWSRFFSHLGVVVIDEAHRYRGVYGSHVALLIRRLRRICRQYGADPQFILSTATLANPDEFGERLCGLPCRVIQKDGAPQGGKHFVLYNPYRNGASSRSPHRESSSLLLACMQYGLQTLCFTGARKTAELITLWTKDALVSGRHGSPEQVSAYRAGYLPEERRSIEDRLKSGVIRGLVSTNALELGIDIGSLDGVILSGYPGTMMSTWQQAGRAGRSRLESLAIMVAFENPLDQYFMRHPGVFFASSHEHAIIDLNNPYILTGQVLCAASELPVNPERDDAYFGHQLRPLIQSLSEQHLVSRTRRGYLYSGTRRPSELVSLGAISEEHFRVLCQGNLLETMDRVQAYREAHPGAILLRQGERYRVTEMDLLHHLVRVEPVDVDYYTKPVQSADVSVTRTLYQRDTGGGIPLSFGDVMVTEQYTAYKTMQFDTVISIDPLFLPPIRFPTRALWFEVPEDLWMELQKKGQDPGGGLHGAEHALLAVMPFHVMCDRWDLGGLSVPSCGEQGGPTVFIYDGFQGGIGLAEHAYAIFEEITAMTRDLVSGCACSRGCPACIFSPKCGNDNQPLDKAGTITILEHLCQAGRATSSVPAGRVPDPDHQLFFSDQV